MRLSHLKNQDLITYTVKSVSYLVLHEGFDKDGRLEKKKLSTK